VLQLRRYTSEYRLKIGVFAPTGSVWAYTFVPVLCTDITCIAYMYAIPVRTCKHRITSTLHVPLKSKSRWF